MGDLVEMYKKTFFLLIVLAGFFYVQRMGAAFFDLGEVDGNAAPILRDLGDDIVLRESPAAVAVLAAHSKGLTPGPSILLLKNTCLCLDGFFNFFQGITKAHSQSLVGPGF